MEQGTLAVEWVEIDRLHLNPSNPRLNDPAVPHVAASIRRFGFQQPVVAKRSGEVIAGNTRLKAARSLGIVQVPVIWFEGSDLDATAYGIADNRTHEFAEWDQGALAKLLEELRAEDSLEGVASDEKAAETMESINTRHLRSARVIQSKALEALKSMSLGTAMDAVKALHMGVRQERLILGEPTDRNAVNVEDVIKREYEKLMVVGDDDEEDGDGRGGEAAASGACAMSIPSRPLG